MRNGWTLVETVITLFVIALMTTLAVPRLGDWLDRTAVRRAASEAAAFYAAARYRAVMRGTRVRVEFGAHRMTALFERDRDSVFLDRPGPAAEGVQLSLSRAVVRIYPNGIGAGGANTSLVFRRGRYEERITLSRLGRLKRWR